jgi:hypothetical protein
MLLMAHTAMGILIASVSTNPIIGAPCAFISHYVLDIIPHESKEELYYVPPQKTDRDDDIRNKLNKRMKSSIFDLGFALVLFFSYCFLKIGLNIESFLPFCIIVFFSVLPDIFTVVYLKYPIKILALHYKWHFDIHKVLPFHYINYTVAVIYQLVLSVGFFLMAIYN